MANKVGRKPNQNGRKQYSQSARAIAWRQENKRGEFADNAAVAVEDTPTPTPLETSPETVPPPGEFSTEAIGVTSEAVIYDYEPELEPEAEEVLYFCTSCSTDSSKTYIEPSDTHCPICEEQINWEALK
jgi:hypothetical protein